MKKLIAIGVVLASLLAISTPVMANTITKPLKLKRMAGH